MTRTPTTPTTPTTTTDREPTAAAATIPVDRLVVHPDNPRRKIGDLAELVRSVHHHGILQPLLVLPADNSGQHRIVAGHRRHAAAVTVGLREVPCLVRSLTAVEAIEAMLIENIQRSDLTTSEEVDAIEDIYEPFLIQKGFLHRTPRGRVATRLAYEHLGFPILPGQMSLI